MARTLPWLSNGASSSHQPARSRPPKRQRPLDPNSDSEDNANTRAVVHPKKQAAPTAVRTPSTSPPPQPPTEEFMRPGLSADDIYIMVEDEFLAVAQTFTKHLHHAEYIRLRRAAKERNASTVNNIPRPVDATTTMREETRRKKEAEARELKMKAAIESIKGPERAKISRDESDIEEDRQDDPWQGTQLQRFMTKSPKKSLPGLTGLQGVTSRTRAAAGYPKPEKRPSQPTKLFEPARPKTGASKPTTVAQVVSGPSSSSEDTDDDDLDAPSRIPSYPPLRISSQPPTTTTTKPIPIPSPNQDPLDRVPKTKHPAPIPSKVPYKPSPSTASSLSLTKPSENRIPPSPLRNRSASTITEHQPSVSEVRQRLQARREREEKERMKKRASSGGMVGGVDEIPLFLV